MAILPLSGSLPLPAGYLKSSLLPARAFQVAFSLKRMLISIANHPRLPTHPSKQRIKPCLQNPC